MGCDFRERLTLGLRDVLSILAAHTGCDTSKDRSVSLHVTFQFSQPVWVATSLPFGRDLPLITFNSRNPCGLRPDSDKKVIAMLAFNSRNPCGLRHQDVAVNAL